MSIEEIYEQAERERIERAEETLKAFFDSFKPFEEEQKAKQEMIDRASERSIERARAMEEEARAKREAERIEKERLEDIALHGSNDSNNKEHRDALKSMLVGIHSEETTI